MRGTGIIILGRLVGAMGIAAVLLLSGVAAEIAGATLLVITIVSILAARRVR